jgi:hypothetical protein
MTQNAGERYEKARSKTNRVIVVSKLSYAVHDIILAEVLKRSLVTRLW